MLKRLSTSFGISTVSYNWRPSLADHEHQILCLLSRNPSRHLSLQIHSKLLTAGYHWNEYKRIVIWNSLLRVYSQGVYPDDALKLYKHALQTSPSFLPTDTFTVSFLLKACANSDRPILGRLLHSSLLKLGLEFHVYVDTALVNMYSVCGCLHEAMKVFDEMPDRNLVTWNVMITRLVKLGELHIAFSLFNEMPRRNVISWTAIIDGFTRANRPREAIALFHKMMAVDRLEPNEITVLTILPAVWNLGNLDMCQFFQGYCEKRGFIASDIRVSNALIDAYAKCGSMKNAIKLFEEIPANRRNLITWTSIISGFAMHGMAKDALHWFEEMEKQRLSPNHVTFLSVLSACSHGGLVKEGLGFFSMMVYGYQIKPGIKHYGCMIDMLGRAGMLKEAEKMALDMPVEMMDVVIWRTLLGACSFHGDVGMGERIMRRILESERDYGADYILMSNIFVGVGRFGHAEKVRGLMDEKNVPKMKALSLLDWRSKNTCMLTRRP
ncbi:hypothetical protein Sjap_012114 [Stephania japonica]|uniref:Pentatricopeptide repeat-containing protein n=1 Tax=Stephania japonica TaxID=461633 RepID=A0AAP0NWG6_9MAGN